jgi:hypothetical protein
MVRTQIQLTDEQASRLKDLARRRHTSMAELVREGVETVIARDRGPDKEERKRRFLAIMGTMDFGAPDIATNHDEYLAEAYLD